MQYPHNRCRSFYASSNASSTKGVYVVHPKIPQHTRNQRYCHCFYVVYYHKCPSCYIYWFSFCSYFYRSHFFQCFDKFATFTTFDTSATTTYISSTAQASPFTKRTDRRPNQKLSHLPNLSNVIMAEGRH